MPYFPVDDDMPFHPKVLAAGNEAMGVWARAGALCKKYATGGLVSAEMALSLGSKKLAAQLVKSGLWDAVEGGYRFHDWEHQTGNGDAATEKKRKEANAERQRRWRASRNGVTDGVTNGVTDAVTNETPNQSVPVVTDFDTQLPTPEALELNARDYEQDPEVIAGFRKALNGYGGENLDELAMLTLVALLIEASPRPVTNHVGYIVRCTQRSPMKVKKLADEAKRQAEMVHAALGQVA